MYQSYALADLVVNYVSRKPGLSQGQRLSHITPVTQSKLCDLLVYMVVLCVSSTGVPIRLSLTAQSRFCNFPLCIVRVCTSSTGGLLRPQHPSRMHRAGVAQEELGCNMSLNYTWVDLHICWVLDRLAPYKLPRALDGLMIYQQPSSTTLYYSYLRRLYLIDGRQEQWDKETIRSAMNA